MDLEDEPKKTATSYAIGQSLSDLSVDEIDEIIGELEAEIKRLTEARAGKAAHLSAAEALFSKS